MEDLRIQQFIAPYVNLVPYGNYNNGFFGFGCCYGSGSGSGSGSGGDYFAENGSLDHGYGYGLSFNSGLVTGSGYGEGKGDGYINGAGDGCNDLCELGALNGNPVFDIDSVPTIIKAVHGNHAKAFIIRDDLSLTPCYIAKSGNIFAHGTTLREAQESLMEKLFIELSVDERIELFIDEHKEDMPYPIMDFFEWHNKLTGSCLFGRQEFAKQHNIDLNGQMTVREFIELTENDYGGEIIKRLKEAYDEKTT